MKRRIFGMAVLFSLSCVMVAYPQTLPSGLKPVHKTLAASCLPGFHASPGTYDNLDAAAHYSCFDSALTCGANLTVWWDEPPAVTAEPRFRYSCKQVQAGTFTTACATGFSAQFARQQAPMQDASVRYSCVSAPVACPAVFTINQNDPNFYGFKSGGFIYRCTKTT